MNKQQAFLMGMAAAKPRTEYVTREVNVTEKRAPTDESVALLMEMEAAARQKIVASYPLESNDIRGELIMERMDYSDSTRMGLVAVINGKRFEIVENSRAETPEKLMEALRDSVAQRLAEELIWPAFMSLRAKGRWPR